jgi:peptidoglycan/LPS O-acetylase OafA/YrhL
MTSRSTLDWIQLLRGVAAVLVVLAHARSSLLDTPAIGLADALLVPGALGVDLFFIISGFIMCYTSAGNDGSGREVLRFVVRRFARVWPVYAAVTLLSVWVLYNGYLNVPDNRRTLWHTLAMLPAQPQQAPYFGLTLPVAWTLEFEMYFYLVFAACLLFRRWRWLALGTWVGLMALALPAWRGAPLLDVSRDLGFKAGYLNLMTSPFVLEFAAGAAIGWLYLQPWARIKHRQLARHLLGLAVGFALWAIYSNAVYQHGPAGYGWPLLLMVLALTSKTIEIRVPPLFMWLGSISYSLYLTHLLSLKLGRDVLIAADLLPLTRTWSFVLASTALALPLASLSHYLLEQKLANWVRDTLMRLLRLTPPAASASAAQPVIRRAIR